MDKLPTDAPVPIDLTVPDTDTVPVVLPVPDKVPAALTVMLLAFVALVSVRVPPLTVVAPV